jgi:uncharacterized membrane protein YoaK (UPF0700 family)
MFHGSSSLTAFQRRNILVWLTLAFQAGILNIGGFLACHRFVTHTTGFATHFGEEAALSSWQSAFGMLTVPGFFLIGCMISGFFIDFRQLRDRAPLYEYSFGLIGLLMLIVSIGGHNKVFGEFGEPLLLARDYALLAILCLCAGLQNATITSASGAVVRTTHLTGITTDLGIGLTRVLTKKKGDQVRKHEAKANITRAGLIFFFILGSYFGALLFLEIEYKGFLIPAVISIVLSVLSFRARLKNS